MFWAVKPSGGLSLLQSQSIDVVVHIATGAQPTPLDSPTSPSPPEARTTSGTLRTGTHNTPSLRTGTHNTPSQPEARTASDTLRTGTHMQQSVKQFNIKVAIRSGSTRRHLTPRRVLRRQKPGPRPALCAQAPHTSLVSQTSPHHLTPRRVSSRQKPGPRPALCTQAHPVYTTQPRRRPGSRLPSPVGAPAPSRHHRPLGSPQKPSTHGESTRHQNQ